MTERMLGERYRLENRIGEGGMATVYSGTDTVLRRRVAVKVLRPQYAADNDFVQRFYSEARHAAKLSHPNIVNTFDVGREDETYYIVMELVEGSTLSEMIEADTKIPEPVAIDYAAQICNGLAYAHRQGLLHRDIKPANILVTKDDVVKISDFGIARAISNQTMALTQTGMVMGSVYYTSPEQAQGHELGESSDLYSLGIVLYQMLTGQVPYTGDTPVTVALKHVSGPIPSPMTGKVPISPALTAIVTKLLQKDPSERFASAIELASALRAAREHPLRADSVVRSSNGSQTNTRTKVLRIPKPPPRDSRLPDAPAMTVPPRKGPLLAALAGIFIAAVVFGYLFLGRPGGPFSRYTLADYTGLPVHAVETTLTTNNLTYHLTPVTSETIPVDHIVRQAPAPGTNVAAKAPVELFVSSGFPTVQLTDLRGYKRQDAENYLLGEQLVARISEKYDEKPKGTVLSQNPKSGPIPMHSTVALVVSKGLAPVAVPEIVSMSLVDATAALRQKHLELVVGERTSLDNVPENVIASQNPDAGVKVESGSKVTVVVSGGAALVVVPEVGGQSLPEATAAVSGAGLVPTLQYIVQPANASGAVIDQTPAGTTKAKRGSTVTLSIAVPGTIPDVAGQSLDAAREAIGKNGYRVGNIAYSTDGAPGKVVRTEPEANATLRPGEAVTIYYNEGK